MEISDDFQKTYEQYRDTIIFDTNNILSKNILWGVTNKTFDEITEYEKTLHKKYKIVKSIRGTKGGYKLEREATEIKLSEILSAVNENIKTVRCVKHLKKGCNGKSIKCNTHKLWDELDIHINSFFEKKLLS